MINLLQTCGGDKRSFITARFCGDPGLIHLLRFLFFRGVSFQFQLPASHIPGVNNTLADLLSHKQLPLFLSHSPMLNPQQSHLSYPSCYWTLRWTGPLPPAVQFFRFRGRASSTRRSYQAGLNHFCRFCMEHNVDPFPVPESLLCYFVASLG